MGARNSWAQAAGFNAMLVPPLALALGVAIGLHWLNFILLLVIAPLAHGAFGDAGRQEREWHEPVSIWLHRLPMLTGGVLLGAIAFVAIRVNWTGSSALQIVGTGASLWAAFAMGSCLAHDLLHRSDPSAQTLGRLIAGAIGYPFLEHEHRSHHQRSDWPRSSESLWAYTARRAGTVVREARARDSDAAAWAGNRWSGGLAVACAAFAITALTFALTGGLIALVCYLAAALTLSWTVQAMTYLQHWGLGEDSLQRTQRERQWSWEDVCMLQAWLTVGLSLHQGHHDREGASFYRMEPVEDAPRLPGGYVPMLLISMVPALWFRVMVPALQQWKRNPHTSQATPDRRLVCVPH